MAATTSYEREAAEAVLEEARASEAASRGPARGHRSAWLSGVHVSGGQYGQLSPDRRTARTSGCDPGPPTRTGSHLPPCPFAGDKGSYPMQLGKNLCHLNGRSRDPMVI